MLCIRPPFFFYSNRILFKSKEKRETMENKTPLTQGTFFLGANYWASHAGTNMWRDWDEKVVDEDFKRFADNGLRLLRIFPLWPDFQPLKPLFGGGATVREVRYESEEVFPFTPEGRAGVDPVMIERFGIVCRLAEKHGISLIIGLITGWMSGRLYVPHLLERNNVLKDPIAIKWEIRFIQYMVRRFKEEKSIIAWELGNECNCMAPVTRDEAYVWSKALTMAVKEIDSTRPMLSGMHGIFPRNAFDVRDQGEITDMLTTHPYPLFTPNCNTDSMITMKSALHAAGESLMYQGIGGKPCFIEEAGNLGPMMVNYENTAHYTVASCMTAWAHNLRAYVWWCMNEQSNLTHAPYDWNGVERELGLFDADKKPKPVMKAMGKMQKYMDEFPVPVNEPIKDAVCILTNMQENWTVAYGTFLLAKQAGLDVTFCYITEEIPEASVYFLPSLTSDRPYHSHEIAPVIERVKKGATLYMSWQDSLLSPFVEYTGVRSEYYVSTPRNDSILLDGEKANLFCPVTMKLEVMDAEVLLSTESGEPALVKHKLGEGTVYYLNYPIEKTAGASSGISETPLYRIYEKLGVRNPLRVASKTDSHLGLTEHPLEDGRRLLVLINYEAKEKEVSVSVADGYKVEKFLPLEDSALLSEKDGVITLRMARNSAVSLIVAK